MKFQKRLQIRVHEGWGPSSNSNLVSASNPTSQESCCQPSWGEVASNLGWQDGGTMVNMVKMQILSTIINYQNFINTWAHLDYFPMVSKCQIKIDCQCNLCFLLITSPCPCSVLDTGPGPGPRYCPGPGPGPKYLVPVLVPVPLYFCSRHKVYIIMNGI